MVVRLFMTLDSVAPVVIVLIVLMIVIVVVMCPWPWEGISFTSIWACSTRNSTVRSSVRLVRRAARRSGSSRRLRASFGISLGRYQLVNFGL